jgi:hypothetical protein
MAMTTKGTIDIIYIFDEAKTFDDDYLKDMLLLYTATEIALGVLILDLLFRVYERKYLK